MLSDFVLKVMDYFSRLPHIIFQFSDALVEVHQTFGM
jgi:hypothetical protein